MRFTYTKQQWDEIRRAVRDGCAQPSNFDEGFLLGEANVYRECEPHYLPPSARRIAWRRVARLLAQTQQAMVAADPLGSFERRALRASEFSFSQELARWQRMAAAMARQRDSRDPNDNHHPRFAFFEVAFDCWLCAGGLLRFSRTGPESSERGRLGGPTIRYLQAVVNPVMGADAPSLEGLRKILESYVLQLEDLFVADEDSEYAAVIESAQNHGDPETATYLQARPRPRRPEELRARARKLVRGSRLSVSR